MAKQTAEANPIGEVLTYKAVAPRIMTVWLRESLQFETATLDRLTAEEFAEPEKYAGQLPVLRGLTLDFDKWGVVARYADKNGKPHAKLLPMAQVRMVDLAE